MAMTTIILCGKGNNTRRGEWVTTNVSDLSFQQGTTHAQRIFLIGVNPSPTTTNTKHTTESFQMTEDDLLAAVKAIAESLKSELTGALAKLDEKCSAVADGLDKLKADAIIATNQGQSGDMRRRDNYIDDPDGTRARQTAADTVGRSELASLSRSVADLKTKMTRTSVDRNAVADLQAKADKAMRVHGDRAEPPMPGESTIDYSIRLARKMQVHSKLWKKVDLNLIAADQLALNNAIDAIRADCFAAGENTEGMQPFQHREITEVGPGGHRITRFVGNGSIFAQMTRPTRQVTYIGVRNTSRL
jgi:hypothetical protein